MSVLLSSRLQDSLLNMHCFFSYMLRKGLLLQDDLHKNRHTSDALTAFAFLLIALNVFLQNCLQPSATCYLNRPCPLHPNPLPASPTSIRDVVNHHFLDASVVSGRLHSFVTIAISFLCAYCLLIDIYLMPYPFLLQCLQLPRCFTYNIFQIF